MSASTILTNLYNEWWRVDGRSLRDESRSPHDLVKMMGNILNAIAFYCCSIYLNFVVQVCQ